MSNLRINIFPKIILTVFLLANAFLLEAQEQKKEVTAKKGDGIYRLLSRHGLSISENLNTFIALNKSALGKDNTLIAGEKYLLPAEAKDSKTESPARAKGKIKTFDIFGDKYADVEIKTSELKGANYYLVAGHGGPDPGAVGSHNGNQVCEDEYAYDVTLRLARKLIEKGATVYMITRDKNDGIRDEAYLRADKDEVCYPNLKIPRKHVSRLSQRTNAVNKLYKKNRKAFHRMIAVHVDSRSRGQNIDVFFYHDKRSETGKKAAKTLQKTFQAKYDEYQPGRGYEGTVSDRSLYVVRNTWPVAVYIELGNINHQRDIQRFIVENNRQAVANWLAQGLVEDFKTNK